MADRIRAAGKQPFALPMAKASRMIGPGYASRGLFGKNDELRVVAICQGEA